MSVHPDQATNGILQRTGTIISQFIWKYKKTKKNQKKNKPSNSQSNLEEEEWNWRNKRA